MAVNDGKQKENKADETDGSGKENHERGLEMLLDGTDPERLGQLESDQEWLNDKPAGKELF